MNEQEVTTSFSDIFSNLLKGPMPMLIVTFLFLIGFQFWQSRQEKNKKTNINKNLKIGSLVKLSDGIIGMVEEIDPENNIVKIKSGDLSFYKDSEFIILVFAEQEENNI